ncbi:MAG TPA: neutral zinc metallopeptidase [Burkholderiales bacterium]|nr:neutral zinc metallopeptidase [Burkholderiales bacterium]
MRLGGQRRSGNIEDRRGMSMGKGVAGGGIGVVLISLVAMFFGVDPSVVLQGMQTTGGSSIETSVPDRNDPAADFVAAVLGSTEDTWTELFRANGRQYRAPTLVLFSGAVQSACGMAQSAVGPFYCPADQKLYIDLSFYRDLRERFQAPGDFAQAYVIAHEVGHHVQNLLGVAERVHGAQQRASQRQANDLSVRMELQADCLAGVWARHADNKQLLETGDIEEGLAAAAAVGDDRIQMQARGYVAPESFTHGSAEQRARWFRRGLDRGEVAQCDSFGGTKL